MTGEVCKHQVCSSAARC